MAEVKEIQLNDNDTGLKVFVNGEPDLSLIPESLYFTVNTEMFLNHRTSCFASHIDLNRRFLL